MLTLEEALGRVLTAVKPLPVERISLFAAPGRVLRETVTSPIDLPHFHNSAMDGYAVRAEDVSAASSDSPVALGLMGEVAAGGSFEGQVTAGTCVRIFTGSPMPAGADAVVMQEDARVNPERVGTVLICDAVRDGENVRRAGEDVKSGQILAGEGEALTPMRLALLSACGVAAVKTGRPPVVGLLATGSELCEPGGALGSGNIYESNRVLLSALLAILGLKARIFPLVKDTLPETRAALEGALSECDAVITTGGVSVGEYDFVKQAWEELGGELGFWKVAIKPGKPFVFGRREQTFLFGLPGNPVSALVTFWLLVRPALLQLQGAAEIAPPVSVGFLGEPLSNRGNRRHFMRVDHDREGKVRLAGQQSSHILHGLAGANGLVDVPPETVLPIGATVPVLRLI